MKPSRTTQPYRRGAREPGPALDAMLKGSASGWDPYKRATPVTERVELPGSNRQPRKPRQPRQPRQSRMPR